MKFTYEVYKETERTNKLFYIFHQLKKVIWNLELTTKSWNLDLIAKGQ